MITNAKWKAVWKKTGENTYKFDHYEKLKGDINEFGSNILKTGGEPLSDNEVVIEEEE
jgi:hypothetical protein